MPDDEDVFAAYRKGQPTAPATAPAAAPAPAAPPAEDPFSAYRKAGPFTPPGGSLPEPPPSSESRLPSDLPEKVGKAAMHSLPYWGALAAGLMAPEIEIPGALAWGATALTGAGMAGLGAGLGSMAESGLEKATDQPEAPVDWKEFATRAGEHALYTGALPEISGRALMGTLGNLAGRWKYPKKLYQAALGPSGKLPEAQRAVATGVREGIPPTEAGVAEATKRIEALHKEVSDIIANTPADIPANQYVNRVSGNLDKLRRQWGQDPIRGGEFVRQLDDFERNFLLRHANVQPKTVTIMQPRQSTIVVPGPNGGHTITIQQPKTVTINPEDMTLAELRQQAGPMPGLKAQGIKQQAYKTIRAKDPSAWNVGTHPGLGIEGEQEIASALKDELGELYPAIKNLNPREGDLINLRHQLEHRVKIELGKKPVPYFPIMAGAGALGAGIFGHHAEAGAGASLAIAAGHMIRSTLADPAVQARIAIIMDRAARSPVARKAGKLAVTLPQNIARAAEASMETATKPPPEEDTSIGAMGR